MCAVRYVSTEDLGVASSRSLHLGVSSSLAEPGVLVALLARLCSRQCFHLSRVVGGCQWQIGMSLEKTGFAICC